LCCFESPGGLLLQTQFWDTHPATGPADSWTIHGLWPDNCDATYNEKCDPSRNYQNISALLTANGASDTLDFMNQFWISNDESSEEFWEHEWATHGTCLSTLNPSCLQSEVPGIEAVAYFQTVVSLFKTLPTYTYLENAGITPSSRKTYSRSEFISALKSAGGVTPELSCHGQTINSISWYFNLQGSIIDGTFVPIDAPKPGNCRSSRIKYPPK
jgi:ribonuclease T2